MIRWGLATREDMDHIFLIVKRTFDLVYAVAGEDHLTATCDLHACHVSGCPLDLHAMAETQQMSDLVHDVAGIRRHIDRRTGKLGDCFVPRFALRQAA